MVAWKRLLDLLNCEPAGDKRQINLPEFAEQARRDCYMPKIAIRQ